MTESKLSGHHEPCMPITNFVWHIMGYIQQNLHLGCNSDVHLVSLCSILHRDDNGIELHVDNWNNLCRANCKFVIWHIIWWLYFALTLLFCFCFFHIVSRKVTKSWLVRWAGQNTYLLSFYHLVTYQPLAYGHNKTGLLASILYYSMLAKKVAWKSWKSRFIPESASDYIHWTLSGDIQHDQDTSQLPGQF